MAKVATTTKKSKYEVNLIKRLDAEQDQDAMAKLAFRKAENILKQQIAALEIRRVYLEIQAEERQLALENATFCRNFSIENYDNAKKQADSVQDDLADVEATIEARKKLLASWA